MQSYQISKFDKWPFVSSFCNFSHVEVQEKGEVKNLKDFWMKSGTIFYSILGTTCCIKSWFKVLPRRISKWHQRWFQTEFGPRVSDIQDQWSRSKLWVVSFLKYSFFDITWNIISVDSSNISPSLSLARYIRDVANLKGTKISCNQAGCGACVVTAKVPDLVSGSSKVISINSVSEIFKLAE